MKNKNIDKRRKKHKKKSIFKKILILILIILLIAIGWFIYKTQKNGGGLSGMLATAVGHNEYTKKNLSEFKVLILGVSTDLDSELTDTIMVASYNPNTQKANLLSIPRDTFTGKNVKTATASQKLNCLYNIYRKPEKTLQAVNEITGLDIKYYILVRTEALIKLVDAIGGVEFNVPRNMNYDDPSQDLHIHLNQGLQKIDGNKAEQLLRYRHDNWDPVTKSYPTYSAEYGDNDFGRMRTQREFIAATLKQTLKPSNIFKIGQILDIANENIETNLELSFIKDYVPYAVEFNTENLKTAVLPGSTPDMSSTNNVSIFVVDKKEAKKLIDSMFYNEGETTEESDNNNTTTSKLKIEILNGSGNKTSLEKAKELLENAGYNVTKTGQTSTVSKTVITNKKNATEEQLNNIKQALKVGTIATNVSSTSLVDVTIIIGTDFKP